MIISSVSFSRFCAILGLLSFCGDYLLLCFFPQGLLHFGFDVVVSVATSGFFSRFCAFWFVVVVTVVITFFWFFSRFCAFMFIRKKVKKKGFLLWLWQQQLEMGRIQRVI